MMWHQKFRKLDKQILLYGRQIGIMEVETDGKVEKFVALRFEGYDAHGTKHQHEYLLPLKEAMEISFEIPQVVKMYYGTMN